MSGAGWNLKNGEMTSNVDVKKALSNFFSKKNKMNNLYKLLLFESILKLEKKKGDLFYEVVIIFSELYFNYKKDFLLNICLYNGRSRKSKADILVEEILKNTKCDYKNIEENVKINYILEIKKILKKNVIGAFYQSLARFPYTFDLDLEILDLNYELKKMVDQNKDLFEELIFLRIIEFFKISEKDKTILEKEMLKKEILYYRQDLYICIQKNIDDLL